jgi:hypothetical protein
MVVELSRQPTLVSLNCTPANQLGSMQFDDDSICFICNPVESAYIPPSDGASPPGQRSLIVQIVQAMHGIRFGVYFPPRSRFRE